MKKVFISHSSIDKPFVRKLKRDLNLNYVNTWVDEDEMFPGDSLIQKLKVGLADSTHFIIVLSPKSVESEWVEMELDNALEQVEESTIEKIIPILYRKCNIPESLEGTLYANLSSDIMHYKNGWIEFSGDNYENEFQKIVKSILISTPSLTISEKEDILNITAVIGGSEYGNPTLRLKVIGYKSKSKFINNYVSKEDKKGFSIEQIEKMSPIVLPKFLEEYLNELKFGSQITLRLKNETEINAEFVKFSLNNNRIAVPLNIREKLGLINKKIYKISIVSKGIIEFSEINDE